MKKNVKKKYFDDLSNKPNVLVVDKCILVFTEYGPAKNINKNPDVKGWNMPDTKIIFQKDENNCPISPNGFFAAIYKKTRNS